MRSSACCCCCFFLIATHEKTSLTKIRKKRYVHYSLLIVQMLSCSQYNTYASYKFDTVYYLQHLHYLQYLRYLQYDTYPSHNTIFVLLTVKKIFFNLQYVYNFVVLVQYTGVYIYKCVFYCFIFYCFDVDCDKSSLGI